MANDDGVHDDDRLVFEAFFRETQRAMVERMVRDRMPNTYLDVVIARMVALRAVVADVTIEDVVLRCERIANAYTKQHQQAHDEIRSVMRAWQANKETKH